MPAISLLVTAFMCGAPQRAPVLPEALEAFVAGALRVEHVDDGFHGHGARGPSTYHLTFTELARSAPTEAWVQLVSHKSPVVRAWAFWALVPRTDVELLPLLLRYLQDETLIDVQGGCVTRSHKLGDFAFKKASAHLSSRERQAAYRWLVLNDNDLVIRPEAFRKVQPDASLRPTLRALATKEKYLTQSESDELGSLLNSPVRLQGQKRMRKDALIRRSQLKALALVVLARYGTDHHLIEEALSEDRPHEETYAAVEMAMATHPTSRFLPFLARHLTLEPGLRRKRAPLYAAIAAHRSPEAARMLAHEKQRMETAKLRARRWPDLMNAMSAHPAPVFHTLMFALWDAGTPITRSGFEALYAKDPLRAVAFAKSNLSDIDTFLENHRNPIPDEELAVKLWEAVMHHDPVAGRQFFEAWMNRHDYGLQYELVSHVLKRDHVPLITSGAQALVQAGDDSYLLDRLVSRLTEKFLDGDDPQRIAQAISSISQ